MNKILTSMMLKLAKAFTDSNLVEEVIELVKAVMNGQLTGEMKKKLVRSELEDVLDELEMIGKTFSEYAINLVIEIAVAYVKQRV